MPAVMIFFHENLLLWSVFMYGSCCTLRGKEEKVLVMGNTVVGVKETL